MLLKSFKYSWCWHLSCFVSIAFGLATVAPRAYADNASVSSEPTDAVVDRANLSSTYSGDVTADRIASSSLPILPETTNLVKEFEGFSSSAYIDSSGLPVIGYGLTKVNGQTVALGQYISRTEADLALEQELAQIQKLVLTHVKVDLNPYQLGALTSLVYNAGSIVITDSTLARKLNAGDYVGASQEFVRWNKANSGGELIVFSGLTKRRLAEQKLFLTPYNQLASNN